MKEYWIASHSLQEDCKFLPLITLSHTLSVYKSSWNLFAKMYRSKVYKQQFTVWLTFFSFKFCYHNFFGYDLVIAELSRAQRSTMDKEIWLPMRTYVHPPLNASQGEILHFNHPRVSTVNRISTRTFRDKKHFYSFFWLNSNVYIDVDNRERARTRDKTKDINFVGIKTWKFYSGGKKRRNASSHQGEN